MSAASKPSPSFLKKENNQDASHDMSLKPSPSSHRSKDISPSESCRDGNSPDIEGVMKQVEKIQLERVKPRNGLPEFSCKAETAFDDAQTHLSTSSTKPRSLDSKSQASGTTFTMDERESLRPDDSASMKAVEEDDSFLNPSSGSLGYDSNARGLRPPERSILPRSSDGPNPQGFPTSDDANIGSHGRPLEPDEKLIEAMNSPKDRLLVLKLEKRIIDFVKSSSEQSLELPPSNAFGRLLAHKLGDYYHLSHFVDNNVTSVRLHRTPYCRLPTPLSELVADKNKTPPPAMPAVKIMRRAPQASSVSGSRAASSVPSKAASEAGGDDAASSSEAMSARDRVALSREEREAKYQAARERIFRDFPESKTDESNDNQPNDASRSNSGNGRRKGPKQRTPYDDHFDARSEYNVYYPGIHMPQGQPPFNGATPGVPFASPPQYAPVPPLTGQLPTFPNAPAFNPMGQKQGSMPAMQAPAPGYPPVASQNTWQPDTVPQSPSYPAYPGQTIFSPLPPRNGPSLVPYPMAHPGACSQQPQPQQWSQPPYPQQFQPLSPPRNARISQWPNAYQPQPQQQAPQSMNHLPYGYGQNIGAQGFGPMLQQGNLAKPPPMQAPYARPPSFSPHMRPFVPNAQGPAVPPIAPGTPPQPGYYGPTYAGQPYQDYSQSPNVSNQSRRPSNNSYSSSMNTSKSSIAKWGTPAHLPPKPPPSEVPLEFDVKGRPVAIQQNTLLQQQQPQQTHLQPQPQQQPPYLGPSTASPNNGPVLVVGSNKAQKPRGH